LFKKTLRSRKAISPILATLLLIVIAVSAIVITYAWVTTFLTSTTGGAGVILNKDNVDWTTGYIIIYVRNTGTSDTELDATYVGTTSTDLVKQTSVTYDPTSKIAYANGGTVAVNVTYSWSVDTTYYFKIAPKTGAALEFSLKSPPS
jgi:flagellin-like protein